MRGRENNHRNGLGSTSIEPLVPRAHPLRLIRVIANAVLKELGPDFDLLYANRGRWSVPPEQLLRVLLLQILYAVPTDQMLMDELNHNFLFRWFVGLDADGHGWTQSSLSKNRERLRAARIGGKFFRKMVLRARPHDLFVAAEFSVDRKLLAEWVGPESREVHGQRTSALQELVSNE